MAIWMRMALPNNRVGPQVLRRLWRGVRFPLAPAGNRRRRAIITGA